MTATLVGKLVKRGQLKWDGAKEHFVGDAEANQRLKLRKQRAKWAIK